MGFESLYKLSLIMDMIDNVSAPMGGIQKKMSETMSRTEKMQQTFGGLTKTGTAMAGLGVQVEEAVMQPYKATFDTKRAIGELASLGVENLQAMEDAAESFSAVWAGTTKADFITAAYDIKSGIASLTDTGVAEYTRLAGVTATATKSSVGTMTDLFATGYGIYKSYYNQMSDEDFAAMFGSGIASSVQMFKTTGDGMSDSIRTLGAAATNAQVPLEEQLSVLGMLQATMSGGEAGTKYKAFLRSAVKGGEELGLSFVDANNRMLSMPEIMDLLRGKFGETMDAAEKMELQQAFGDQEAVALIDLMYSKTGDLQSNILQLYDSMGQGETQALNMARAINNTDPAKYDMLKQKLHNVSETLGNAVAPTMDKFFGKASDIIDKTGAWIESHQQLAGLLMTIVMVLGAFLTVGGAAAAVIGGIGLIGTKTAAGIHGISTAVKILSPLLKVAGSSCISFVGGLAGMAKQAIITAVQALPGLIGSVWSFTAALLANPVTWVVLGIMALIAAIILLWQNWDSVVSFITGLWSGFVNGIKQGAEWVKNKIDAIPDSFLNVLAVVFPFIGIPAQIIKHWGSISAFFSGIGANIRAKMEETITRVKTLFTNLPQTFRDSGKKIMLTFAEGIKEMIMKPVEIVKGGLQKIREMLPFSDAKTGPLSQLTLSGSKVLTTFSEGIEKTADAPAEAINTAFTDAGLSVDKQAVTVQSANSRQPVTGAVLAEDSKEAKKRTIIEKLIFNVDLKTISELKKMLKLLDEIEEYTNSNAVDEEPEPA